MQVKDYYTILNIPASATMEEVKKAFRKLALLYHPDKNPDTRLANAKFAEIREAYSVLSDRKKRAAYNYTRYAQSPDNIAAPLVCAPEEVLQLCIQLRNKISRLDPFRIDRDQLFFELSRILSDHNLSTLETNRDADINRKVLYIIMESMQHLQLDNAKEIIEKLRKVAGKDLSLTSELKRFFFQTRLVHYWNRYKFLIALTAAVLICLFIYTSRK